MKAKVTCYVTMDRADKWLTSRVSALFYFGATFTKPMFTGVLLTCHDIYYAEKRE